MNLQLTKEQIIQVADTADVTVDSVIELLEVLAHEEYGITQEFVEGWIHCEIYHGTGNRITRDVAYTQLGGI